MSKTRNPLILVVDADERRATRVAALLGAGAETCQAVSAEEALSIAGELPELEAVVIHRELPDSDGFDAVEFLNESSQLEGVPKIVVAAEDDAQSAKRSVEAHCDAYIVESDPVARAQLAGFTIALLRASSLAA